MEPHYSDNPHCTLRLRVALWLLLLPMVAWADSVSYTYDDLNRLIRAEYESGAVIEYSYDSAGNRTGQVITVAANQPPVANAGPDRKVRLRKRVTLNGSNSFDPDSGPTPLRYSWNQISGPRVALSGAETAMPRFRPKKRGNYTFRLIVNDGIDNSSPDMVLVRVRKKRA